MINEVYKKSYHHFSKDDPITGFPEENKDAFRHRFQFTDKIQLTEDDLMKNFYCSIIVPAQCKKRILKELDQFGISQSFIFPETEYTAKEIRKRYFL